MARKKNVDFNKLIKAVESGMPAKEIMSTFNIKSRIQLKSLYADALVEKGKAAPIAGRASRAGESAKKSRGIAVNKRGSLVVPRSFVEEMGYAIGDMFTLRRTKSGLSLKKA
jgi:hypothetical protein